MPRSLLAPSLRVLALLVLLAVMVTVAMAPAHSGPAGQHAAAPGGPLCCGGGTEQH